MRYATFRLVLVSLMVSRKLMKVAMGAVVVLLTSCACEGKRPPTTPTPQPSSSITSVVIQVPPRLGTANTVGIGIESALTAVATFSDGQTSDVSQLAVWQSSDPTITRVNGRFVTGLKVGSATLSASYQGVVGSQLVTTRKCIAWELYAPPLMWLGQSVTFSTTAYNVCALNPTRVSPTWSTTNPAILVLQPGPPLLPNVTVVGGSPGTAILKATVGNDRDEPEEQVSSVTVLNVRRPPPEFLWFNINDPLLVGESGQLLAGAQWFNPIEWREDVSEKGFWKSSNRSVVAISPDGRYTARAVGSVVISVEFEGARRDIATRVVR